MYADLWANLAVRSPGVAAPALRALATFRRRGRVSKPEDRFLVAWSEVPGWLYLPRGLRAQVDELVPHLQVTDRRLVLPRVDFRFTGHLYGYQEQALTGLRHSGGGTLVAPSGGGKTEMGLAFAAWTKQPTLWLVHSLDLAEQTLRRAQRLYQLDDSAFGLVCEGHRAAGSHLTVATIETLSKYPELARSAGRRHGCVIVDEAHHTPAVSFLRVLRVCPGRYRLALTATDNRTDGLGPAIPALMGPRIELPVSVLVRAGRLTVPDVYVVFTGYPGTPDIGWAAYRAAQAGDARRNAMIVAEAVRNARAGGRVLIIVELVNHAHLLARLVRGAGVRASAIVGEVGSEHRTTILETLRRVPGCVVVATKLADEGLDLPELDNLHLATPGTSDLRLRQQVGRTMRPYPGKRHATVYDWTDTGSLTLRKHHASRVHTYRHFGDIDLRPRRHRGSFVA